MRGILHPLLLLLLVTALRATDSETTNLVTRPVTPTYYSLTSTSAPSSKTSLMAALGSSKSPWPCSHHQPPSDTQTGICSIDSLLPAPPMFHTTARIERTRSTPLRAISERKPGGHTWNLPTTTDRTPWDYNGKLRFPYKNVVLVRTRR